MTPKARLECNVDHLTFGFADYEIVCPMVVIFAINRNSYSNSFYQVLGRLASQISTVIQGKDKPTYAPNRDDGDMCIVLNAKDIYVSGRKPTDKIYYWHTG